MATKKNGWGTLPELNRSMAFPKSVLNYFPDIIRIFIISLALAFQCELGIAVGAFLGALSTCAVGRVVVTPQPTHCPRHKIAAQLYTILCAESCERKSTSIEECQKPIREYLGNREAAYGIINQMINDQEAISDAEAVRDIMSSSKDLNTIMQDKNAANKEFDQYKPTSKNTFFSDLTPEGLARSLTKSGGIASIITGEPEVLKILSGELYGAVNLQLIKDGFNNGHGEITRSKRTLYLPFVALSFVIGAQPDAFDRFMGVQNGGGLHERFIMFSAPPLAGTRKPYTSDIPEDVLNEYSERIKSIIDRLQDRSSLMNISFTSEAEAAYEKFLVAIEARRAVGGDLGKKKIRGWSERIKTTAARIAVLMALYLGEEEVSLACWKAAEHLVCEYLIPCAKAAFGLGGLSMNAKVVISHLVDKDSIEEAELYRLMRNLKAFKDNKAAFDRSLKELKACGLIKIVEPEKKNGPGRARSPLVLVHPDIDQAM